MNITEEKQDGIVVLKPEGRLDSTESPQLEQVVLGAIERGDTKLVIDLSQVAYVSSRGLRVFLMGAKQAAAGGGSLAVCSLQTFTRKVFQAVGFPKVLGIFDTVQDAIDSFDEVERG